MGTHTHTAQHNPTLTVPNKSLSVCVECQGNNHITIHKKDWVSKHATHSCNIPGYQNDYRGKNQTRWDGRSLCQQQFLRTKRSWNFNLVLKQALIPRYNRVYHINCCLMKSTYQVGCFRSYLSDHAHDDFQETGGCDASFAQQQKWL